MTSNIPYQFQHFEDVPVEYMETGDLAKAVEMDAIIPVIQQIEDRYNMGNIVSEVIRRNQEAINLINNSQTEDDLYPRANEFNGNDDDYLDQLHNRMDRGGDVAHDKDWEDKPSFANNTPENRWRDLRHLADSTFTDHTMEAVIKNKQNNNQVEHDLKEIQNQLPDYANVKLVREDQEDSEEDNSGDQEDSAQSSKKRKFLIAGAIIITYMVVSK